MKATEKKIKKTKPTGQGVFRTLSGFCGLLDNLREMILRIVVRFLKLFEAFVEGGVSSETRT